MNPDSSNSRRTMRRLVTGVAGTGLLATSLTMTGLTTTGTAQARPASPIRTAAADDAARVRADLGLSADQRLVETDRFTGPDGTEHIRYDRRVKVGGRELEVLGGDLVVHRKDGADDTVTWAGPESLRLPSGSPSINESGAARIARNAESDAGRTLKPTGRGELVVDTTHGAPSLTWRVRLGADPATARDALVTADDGDFVRSWPANPGAEGVGRTGYSGRVKLNTMRKNGKYILKDPSRGGSRTRLDDEKRLVMPRDADNRWGTGKRKDLQTKLADVQYGVQATWNFYKDVLNRKGYSDDGRGLDARLGTTWGGNAFWSDECECFTVGGRKPFFGSMEVVGHEVSHGLVTDTAGLDYWGDAGGLNESTADIMGTLVEFHSKNKADVADYWIGEKFFGGRKPPFLRRMDRPSLDGASYDCYVPEVSQDDPHYASGIGNHFFYLLAQGTGKKTFAGLPHNGVTCGDPAQLTGLGNDVAVRIWYDALRTYMVSTTTYPEARDATIRATADAFGGDSEQCRAVEDAWSAVDVGAWDWTCSGPLEPGPNQLVNGDFEDGLNGWTTSGNVRLGDQVSGGHHLVLQPERARDKATVRQQVTVPDSPSARLAMRSRVSDPRQLNGYADLFVVHDGQRVWIRTIEATKAWRPGTVPLGGYAGETITVLIRADAWQRNESEVQLDDLSVNAPSPGA